MLIAIPIRPTGFRDITMGKPYKVKEIDTERQCDVAIYLPTGAYTYLPYHYFQLLESSEVPESQLNMWDMLYPDWRD